MKTVGTLDDCLGQALKLNYTFSLHIWTLLTFSEIFILL
jgi:hypothetical protein